MTDERPEKEATAPLDAAGSISLFGFDTTSATVHLRPRSRSWRVGGSVRTAVVTLVLAPAVGIFPPHVPWILGVLFTGGFLARRRLNERFTVVGVDGTCPRCGGAVEAPGGKLRSPHPVVCTQCHHEASVAVPEGSLDGRASGAG